MLILPAYFVLPSLRFTPTATSNRLTDYALAVAVGAPMLAGVALILAALRWLLLAVWPGRLVIEVDEKALKFRLGPFGHRDLDWSRMEASYSHEREDDPDEEPDPELLALEPEDEMAAHLPRMRHPRVAGDVRWLILRFADADEAEFASVFYPYVQQGRKRSPGPPSPSS